MSAALAFPAALPCARLTKIFSLFLETTIQLRDYGSPRRLPATIPDGAELPYFFPSGLSEQNDPSCVLNSFLGSILLQPGGKQFLNHSITMTDDGFWVTLPGEEAKFLSFADIDIYGGRGDLGTRIYEALFNTDEVLSIIIQKPYPFDPFYYNYDLSILGTRANEGTEPDTNIPFLGTTDIPDAEQFSLEQLLALPEGTTFTTAPHFGWGIISLFNPNEDHDYKTALGETVTLYDKHMYYAKIFDFEGERFVAVFNPNWPDYPTIYTAEEYCTLWEPYEQINASMIPDTSGPCFPVSDVTFNNVTLPQNMTRQDFVAEIFPTTNCPIR